MAYEQRVWSKNATALLQAWLSPLSQNNLAHRLLNGLWNLGYELSVR